MNERLVVLTEDFAYRDDCSRKWNMSGGVAGWNYRCQKHGCEFDLHEQCPGSVVTHRAGETVSIPASYATQLVRAEHAHYPTHHADVSESVQGTLDRVNAMLDERGLPLMDAEGMDAIGIGGRASVQGHSSNPYGRPRRRAARPRDTRLAHSLGMDPADIADMRKLAKGEDPS